MPTPPVAKIVPRKLEAHGTLREDPYYWLNQREDPEVIAYLEAENAYTRSVMAHTEQLQETLFEEIKGRLDRTTARFPTAKTISTITTASRRAKSTRSIAANKALSTLPRRSSRTATPCPKATSISRSTCPG